MKKLVRFSVSLEEELVGKFERLAKEHKYPTRSEAFRDLIRKELVRDEWAYNEFVAGAITLIYDHHRGALVNKLIHIQHDFQYLIISTQHVHLDHHNCLEIVACKGKAGEVKKLLHSLEAMKGVKHVTLSMSSTGRNI